MILNSFGKKIKPKKKKVIGKCNFHEYFKNLNNTHPFMGDDEEEMVNDWERGVLLYVISSWMLTYAKKS